MFESDGDSTSERSRSLSKSPLAGKGKAKATPTKKNTIAPREIREYVPDGPEAIILPSDDEDAELTETDDGDGDDVESGVETGTTGSEGDDDDDEEDEEDEEDDWVPSTSRTPRAKAKVQRPPSPSPVPTRKPSANKTRLSKLEREMGELSLAGGVADDSVIILSVKKFKPRQESVDSGEDEEFEVSAVKKKKRYVFNFGLYVGIVDFSFGS